MGVAGRPDIVVRPAHPATVAVTCGHVVTAKVLEVTSRVHPRKTGPSLAQEEAVAGIRRLRPRASTPQVRPNSWDTFQLAGCEFLQIQLTLSELRPTQHDSLRDVTHLFRIFLVACVLE